MNPWKITGSAPFFHCFHQQQICSLSSLNLIDTFSWKRKKRLLFFVVFVTIAVISNCWSLKSNLPVQDFRRHILNHQTTVTYVGLAQYPLVMTVNFPAYAVPLTISLQTTIYKITFIICTIYKITYRLRSLTSIHPHQCD